MTLLSLIWLWPGMLMDLGLHGDEAYVGLAAHDLLHGGAWHLEGMNSHTGPLHQWLVAATFKMFGTSLTTLRAPGAVLNACALGAYTWALIKLLGRPRALWGALLLLTTPAVSALGAVAFEHFALSFALAVGAWLLLDNAVVHQRRGRALMAGVLLGLGTWTHLVFVAAPVACVAVAWARWGRRLWHHPIAQWALWGWLMVEAVPLVGLGERIKIQHGGIGIAQRLARMPALLFDTWQGYLVALRTVGHVDGPHRAWALGASVCALAVVVAAIVRRHRSRPLLVNLCVGLGAFALTLAIIAPVLSDRLFWMGLLLLPPLWVSACFAAPELLGLRRGCTIVGHALCLALLLLQLSFVAQKLVLPWRRGLQYGNAVAPFGIWETSNHYLDTRPVYAALVVGGDKDVVTQNFIGWALRFWDLADHQLTVRLSDSNEIFEPQAEVHADSTLVSYARGYRDFKPEVEQPTRIAVELEHFTLLRPVVLTP
jgi:hypothetical protein